MLKWIRQFVGLLAFVLLGAVFVVAEVVSRIVLVPVITLRPRLRLSWLTAYVQTMRKLIFAVLRLTGARFTFEPRVPCRGGVLIVMNHQSLVDVPAVFGCVPDGYPRMVARARYGKGVPLVSHMLQLYGHILVQPGRTGRAELEALAQTARTSTLPIMIYPEGHRSRDGEIRPWKRAGLDAFLGARTWEVHVLVVDGLWQAARIPDFLRTIANVRCRIESAGVFTYDGSGKTSHDAFIDLLHTAMCDKLAEMRGLEPSKREPVNAS